MYKRMLLPPLAAFYKVITTPTRPMGRIFTELAMSQGEPLAGGGITMGGRTLDNTAILRLSAGKE